MEQENGLPTAPPSPAASSRWNPTKEQISLLEGLYREGVRTPTAEQIQQITGKLRKYGRIEGKNVFYWFQNHKARQRQKQKQESLGYFARFLRTARVGSPVLYPRPPPPALLPTMPGYTDTKDVFPAAVVRTPICMPQYAGVRFYSPFQRVVVPGALHMRLERGLQNPVYGNREGTDPCRLQYGNVIAAQGDGGVCMDDAAPQETLQLFPLRPTRILEDRSGCTSICSISSESESLDEGDSGEKPPPFDFFGSGRSP